MSISSLSDSEIIEKRSSKLREGRDTASSPILSIDQGRPSDNTGGDERGAAEVLPSSETGSIKSALFETPTHSRGFRPPSSTDAHSEHSGKGFSFPRPWKTPGDGDSSTGTPMLSTPTERGRLRGMGRRYRRALSSGSENSGNGGGEKKVGGNSSGSGSGSGGSRQGQRKRRASFAESPFRMPRESLRATGRGIIMRSSPHHSRMQVGPRRSSPPEEGTVRGREVGGRNPVPESEEGEGKGAGETDSVGGGSKSRSKGSRTSNGRLGSGGKSRPRHKGQEGETSSKRGSTDEDAGSSRGHSPSPPLDGRKNEKGDGASVTSAAAANPETLVEEKESVVARAPKRSKSIQSIDVDVDGGATTPSTGVTSVVANNANGTVGSIAVPPPRPPLERSKRSRSIGEVDGSRERHMRSLSPGAYSAVGTGTSIVVPRVEASPGVARPSARLRDHVAGRVKRSESMKRGSTGRSQSAVAVLDLRRNSLNGTGEGSKNDPGPPSTSPAASGAVQEKEERRTEQGLYTRSSVEEVTPSEKRDRVVKESVGDIDGDGKRAVSPSTPQRSAVRRKEEGSSSPGSEINGHKADSMMWENALRKSIPLMLQRASSKVTDASTPRVLEDKTPLGNRKKQLLDPSPSSLLNGHSQVMFPVTKDQKEQPAFSENGGGKEPETQATIGNTAAPGASSSSRSPLSEWLLKKKGSGQSDGRVARDTSVRDANKSGCSGSTSSGSTSSSEDESGGFVEETREVSGATEPFDSEEEAGRTADADNVQYRYTARSRIRELSYQSARSRSRGSCHSLSSLTRVVEVSEESESSSQTSDSFEKAIDDADASEPVTMPRLEQPKRKQKQEGGLASSRSVRGNAPGPATRPSSDVREDPLRPSHIASLSRPLSRPRNLGREDGERAAEHESNGAQSASVPVPKTASDVALAARREVPPSRAPQKLPSRESTPGMAATEVAAETKERSETLSDVDDIMGAARSVDGSSTSSSNVCNLLVGTPSLTEDASRAVEEALNVPPMFTPSSAAAAVLAAAAVAVSDSGDDSGDDDVSRTSLASSVPTEVPSVDTGLHGNVGAEPDRGRNIRRSRLGGDGESEGSTRGGIEPDYDNDADDNSSFDADTWSDFTGRSSGGSGHITRSLTPLSAGDSIASSASVYKSARGSRGSTGTPGRAGWREQAKIRKAMVLAAQKAQEKAIQAGKGLDVGRVDGSWTSVRSLPGGGSVASMTPVRDGEWIERGRSRSRTGTGSEEAGYDASRGGTGEDERRRERSGAGSSKAWSSSGSTYSARSRSLGGPDVYERGPR